MNLLGLTTCLSLAFTGAALADDVTDALAAAQEAYAAGSLSETAARITAASQAVLALQAARLTAFLPQAPEGWTREVEDTGAEAAGMAMMGMIGNMVRASYYSPEGNSISLTLTADSPMVAQMAGILGSEQMMAMMGKVVTVGGQDMLEQESSLSALVGNRVLVQAQGMESAAILPLLETMDFAGLADFDA